MSDNTDDLLDRDPVADDETSTEDPSGDDESTVSSQDGRVLQHPTVLLSWEKQCNLQPHVLKRILTN